MVRLLLEYKARPQQTAGVCYPEPHIPYYSSHSKFFFVSPSMVCGGCTKNAYQRAIDLDDVSLLEPLLLRKNSSILTTVSAAASNVIIVLCYYTIQCLWGLTSTLSTQYRRLKLTLIITVGLLLLTISHIISRQTCPSLLLLCSYNHVSPVWSCLTLSCILANNNSTLVSKTCIMNSITRNLFIDKTC